VTHTWNRNLFEGAANVFDKNRKKDKHPAGQQFLGWSDPGILEPGFNHYMAWGKSLS
jgi:hypothetical protein